MFDEFLPNFERAMRDLEKVLQGEAFGPYRDAQKPPRAEGASNPSTAISRWSAEDFRKNLRSHGLGRTYPVELPDQIDLSEFRRPMDRLLARMREDGREHGRAGVADLLKDSIQLQDTSRGTDESVAIPVRQHPLAPQVICMHTHPTPLGLDKMHSYHLSLVDIKSFLSVPSAQATIVIAEGLTLMAYRTAATPTLSPALEQELQGIQDRTYRDLTIPFSKQGSRFTRRACERLNLGLYILKHSQSDHVAKRVLID